MRVCGSCTTCCKIPAIPAIKKPSNQWCSSCDIGVGCKIYPDRPQACKDFRCLWLTSDMPEQYRPDLAHLYVSVTGRDQLTKVFVDAEYPSAWREGIGKEIVDALVDGGNHVLIVVGRSLEFVPGRGLPVPDKIQLDWLL